MTRSLLALQLLAVVACAAREPVAGAPAPEEAPPAVREAHARLFAAADRGALDGFRACWAPESQALLDRYFAAVATLERSPGAPAVDWMTFMEAHAELPSGARLRTPYALVGDQLDLTRRPEARYFQEVARNLRGAPERPR